MINLSIKVISAMYGEWNMVFLSGFVFVDNIFHDVPSFLYIILAISE